MKKIGIIGGLGPESTLEYYKQIIEAFNQDYQQSGFPQMIIDSLNLKEFIDFVDANNWDAIITLLIDSCNRLYNAGAEFGAIASNTPHKVFHEVQKNTELKLISIVQSSVEWSSKAGIKRLGLIGTLSTMSSDFYQSEFNQAGIEVFTPNYNDQQYINQKLFSEVEMGIIKPDTKKEFISIINSLKKRHDIEGIVLGCTELPLIIRKSDIDIRIIDTMKIHIEKIISECRK